METKKNPREPDLDRLLKERKLLEIRLNELKVSITKCDSQDTLTFYSKKCSVLWSEIEDAQLNIELTTNSLDEQLQVRWRLEKIYQEIRVSLDAKMKTHDNTSKTSEISTLNAPNIPFQPYTAEESFQNFTRRFENYINLRGNISPQLKVDLFLQAITPRMHEFIYDTCIPNDPHEKTYQELIQLIMSQIEPKQSISTRQYNFSSRVQLTQESFQQYASILKKLSLDCQFNCGKCNESISDTVLRMQFVKGILDQSIRQKLLEDDQLQSFQAVVEEAVKLKQAKGSATNESVVKAFGGGALNGGVQMRVANSSVGLFGDSKPATACRYGLQQQSLVPLKSLETRTTKPNN